MWQQICLTNRENISALLKQYIGCLTEIRAQIDAGSADALYDFFDTARSYRESFITASSGPIKTEYVLTMDIADRPGSIADIASLLAADAVSIKNIGINHNRELAEGTLRIEFYGMDAVEKAAAILTAQGYTVHTRHAS